MTFKSLSTPRNISTLLKVFNLEIRRLVTYRSDFWVNFFGQIFFSLVVAYFLWSSIFEAGQTTNINGLTIQGMIFYYLVAPLVFRIQQGTGIGFISREIYDGNLNKYLIYPLNYYQYKLATYLANSVFIFLQLIVLMSLYNLFFYDPVIYSFDLVNTLAFIIVVTISSISFFYLFSIFEFMAFWFDNIWSLAVILRFLTSFLGGVLIPLKLFPEWAQTLLYYTPFPYFIDFPMNVFTGNMTLHHYITNLIILVIWLLVFRFLSILTWKKGNYSYTGVGI
jgi:ABC-2 type transport system permease protein